MGQHSGAPALAEPVQPDPAQPAPAPPAPVQSDALQVGGVQVGGAAPAVVVVGGAGTFGSRLVRGLLDGTGMRVVVAGRSLARAQAFADGLAAGGLGTGGLGAGAGARVTAARLDAGTADAAALRALGAFAVVDAAGPFRPGRDGLARAAAAAGAHYLDLADGRAFVAGFAAGLDGAARAAGVVALTGASSTPALSCAVLDQLTAGWAAVETVETSILPGNRAPRGLAVMQSILSWVGQPVRVLLDGRWTARPGWGLTRREDLPGLGRRWSSLADTPDLDLVPARYRVTGSAVFRAGLELPLLHLGLLALSLPVRAARVCGLRLSLAPLAPALLRVAALLERAGTDRGGMAVEAAGRDACGQPVRRRWTLVAVAGDGPVIPTLPALAVLRAMEAGAILAPGTRACAPGGGPGDCTVPEPSSSRPAARPRLQPGARPCVGAVTLDEITACFAPYGITASVQEVRPLFAAVLGEAAFAALPPAVRAVHGGGAGTVLEGRADVDGPAGLLAQCSAGSFRFPRTASGVGVRVTVAAGPGGAAEAWTRDFAGRRFSSRLRGLGGAGAMEERFGPFAFRLAVAADAAGLSMRVVGWRLGPVPLPRAWAPRARAREWEDAEGRFRFEVEVTLPLAGRVTGYRGWLVPVRMEGAG